MEFNKSNMQQEEICLRACDVDLRGFWRPSSMFFAMQELAEQHCVRLGHPRESMIACGVVWVLVRVRLDVVRFPRLGETICMKTWPGATSRALFPRYFSFSSGGETLGCASTQWMLVDTTEHRMALPSEYNIVVEAGGEPPTENPQRLRYALAPDLTSERRVSYSDLDLNRHMNNARYLEWICDLFPPERFEAGALRSLQINYVSEAKPDETIKMELTEQGKEFSMHGIRADGNVVFEAAGTWME